METPTAVPPALSLVEQIARLSPPAEQPGFAPAPEEGHALSDGYQRNSPVQAYREPPEYLRQRRIKTIAAAVLTAAVVVLLVVFMPRLWRMFLRMVK